MAQNRGPSHTIFIGNLPYDLTENDLANIFQEVGPVKHVRIVLDKETQKPKGFAFVEFFDIATAESAVRNMNNYEVNGRTIRVNFADDQPDRAGRGRGPGDFRGPPGSGPPMPEPPAAAKVPVGMPASASAAQAMSTMLGGPPIMGGPAQEQTNNALASLSRAQLFDIMSQMKLMAMQDSKALRELLISHPQLSKALLQAQVMLGMVQQQGAPAPVPAPGPMMQQQPGPMNGSGAYGGQPRYGPPGQAYPTGPQPMQQVPQNPAPMQPAPMQHQPMAPVQPQAMVHQPMQHQPMAPVQPQPMTSLKATPMQHVAPQPMTSLQQPQQSQPPPMQHMQQFPPQPAAPQPMAPVPADPRMQAAAPADPRLQGVPSDPRMQQAAAPVDPRMQAQQPAADPRMQAADPRLQAAQAPQPMQQAAPAAQPAAAAQPVAQLAPATQQQLLQQIMSMSQEQIDQLPPSHKAQVLALRSKMMGQA